MTNDTTSPGGDSPLALTDLVCDGMMEVEIKVQQRGVSGSSTCTVTRPAMIATARNKGSIAMSTDSAEEALALIFTDGSTTYRGSVLSSNVKGGGVQNKPGDTGQNIAMIRSYFLQSHSNITAAYMLIDAEDTAPRVKVNLRERLDSGIVKMIWSGYLTAMQAKNGDEMASAPEYSNVLPFASILGTSLDDATKEISNLRRELDKVRADLMGWKDTADKLDGRWQKEKDDLTDRFLTLYNRVKSDLRKVRSDLSEEKKKKEVVIKPTVPNALAPPDKTCEGPAGNVDDDYVLWDQEEVDRLAAGPSKGNAANRKGSGGTSKVSSSAKESSKVRGRPAEGTKATSKRKLVAKSLANAQNDDDDVQNSPGDDHGVSQSSARANPLTGAVEMWGPEAIFSESQDDFGTYRDNRNAKKLAAGTSRAKSTSSVNADGEGQFRGRERPSAGDDSPRKRSRHTADGAAKQGSKRSATPREQDAGALRTPQAPTEGSGGEGPPDGHISDITTDGEGSEPLV